ncbi:MAG: peptidylprolyl isomerase [bacterium]
MGVMKHMRDKSGIILLILLVGFVLSMTIGGLVGGANIIDIITGKHPNAIAVVNGKEISDRKFYDAYNRELQAFRDRTDTEPSEYQLESIRNQVLESLIQDILIQETLQKKSITANDEEIVYRIFNDPPEFLKSQESFQNDQKQFDMAKYQAALNDPGNARQWRFVEEFLRQNLPLEKLQQRLQASVRITEDEVKREYLRQNQKVKIKYIFFDPKMFLNVTIEISNEDIENYYKNNKEEFKEEEKRKIQYVLFPIKATAEDSIAKWDLAKSLLERVKSGEDFGELAEIYSEDPGSKEKGGDLGFFGKGAMIKEFEEAAFATKVGDIVGPIQSDFGLHIIKVEEKRYKKGKKEIRARHILIKFEASQSTYNKTQDEAFYFAEEVHHKPFDQFAKESGLSVQITNFFPKGSGFIPGLGLNKRASRFIFENKIGKVGEVEETPQGFFVYRIAEIQNERIKPLAEVKVNIKTKLMAEKRMAMAGELAQKVYEKIQTGLSFEKAAAQDSLEIKQTEPFTKSGYVPEVGRDTKFVGAAFAIEKVNEVSKSIEGTKGYYILQLIEKNELDPSDYESKKETLAQQLLLRKQNQIFTTWYTSLKAKADIKDYRDRYF